MVSKRVFNAPTPEHFVYAVTRLDLENTLNQVVGKTLGEVDTAHVFDKTKTNSKITGIAGDVIEQSVLGYQQNNLQEPDLVVDGEPIELKTTGLKRLKRTGEFTAKEPMSITAVSLDKIVEEDFDSSAFFHKVRKMLIVYYLYDSDNRVQASEYANFPIEGYQFHEFSDEDMEILRNDWQIVHDFIQKVQLENEREEDRKALYPKLSSELRGDLMFIDTAPKYPHPPRFRLKQSVVTDIAQRNFGKSMEKLPQSYTSYSVFDQKLHAALKLYEGRTIEQIGFEYGIVDLKAKNISESIVVNIFEGRGKMSDIDLFSKIGLRAKSLTLTKDGMRTEDMKFFTIDFDELMNPGAIFEESLFYSHFADSQFLFVVFEEPSHDAPLKENVLKGFKRFSFNESFIQNEVRRVWEKIRELIFSRRLKFVPEIDKKTGHPKINSTGEVRGAPNFPKAKDGDVFIRGTGRNSADKPVCINGIRMYRQNVWVKGSYMATQLKSIKWI